MIKDISIEGEFFDPDFFVYREDADVAWRAQLMGWRCVLYAARTRIPCPQCSFLETAGLCHRRLTCTR